MPDEKTGALDDAELKSAKDRLAAILEENERIQHNEIKVETKSDEGDGGVGYKISAEAAAAYRANMAEAKSIRDVIDITEGTNELKTWMQTPTRSSMAVLAEAVQAGVRGGMNDSKADPLGGKTVGSAFIESDEWKVFRQAGGLTMPQEWKIDNVNLGDRWMGTGFEQKDVYSSAGGTYTVPGFGQTQVDPLIGLQHRKTRIRDFFPVTQTTAALIDFMRVTGFTNAASPVPERSGGAFGLKPQSGFTFTPHQAPVRTVAHWEVAHRNVLEDEPQLQGILNNELLYGLRLAEDDQILNGKGTSEDLLGILNTTGVQTYDYGAAASPVTNRADAVRRAATLGLLAYYDMTGVIMHPYDWEGIELLKNSLGNYIVATSVAVGGVATLWQMPVAQTVAMPQHTALVGAFGLGAQLYDRMQANIRISEHHSDFFVRNAIVILAEQRLALAVKRPESFVKITNL